jgi:hypothetical protein
MNYSFEHEDFLGFAQSAIASSLSLVPLTALLKKTAAWEYRLAPIEFCLINLTHRTPTQIYASRL